MVPLLWDHHANWELQIWANLILSVVLSQCVLEKAPEVAPGVILKLPTDCADMLITFILQLNVIKTFLFFNPATDLITQQPQMNENIEQ